MLFLRFSTFVHRPSKKNPRKKFDLLEEGRVTSLKIDLSVDFWGYGIPLIWIPVETTIRHVYVCSNFEDSYVERIWMDTKND
jgi:hypothetical protein